MAAPINGYLSQNTFYATTNPYASPFTPVYNQVYHDLATNKDYRWTGSYYSQISQNLRSFNDVMESMRGFNHDSLQLIQNWASLIGASSNIKPAPADQPNYVKFVLFNGDVYWVPKLNLTSYGQQNLEVLDLQEPVGTIKQIVGTSDSIPAGWMNLNFGLTGDGVDGRGNVFKYIYEDTYPDLYHQLQNFAAQTDSEGRWRKTLYSTAGRVLVGEGSKSEIHNNNANRTYSFLTGLLNWSTNSTTGWGSFFHKLTVGELPAHAHEYPNYGTEDVSSAGTEVVADNSGEVSPAHTTSPTGGNEYHNNMQHFFVTMNIIKVQKLTSL